jgi:uncharacterized protein
MIFLNQGKNNCVFLALYIQPKASKNGFRGQHGDELKLAITSPPVDGKANTAVIAYLADFFKLNKKSVSIKSGVQSRHKRCTLTGISLEETRKKILKAL